MSVLDRLAIASPCNMRWSQMKGDNQKRFCGACKQNVYNIEGLSRDEAEALVARVQQGEKICMRLYRRADGTFLTADCSVGARMLARARRRWAALKFSAMSLLSGMLFLTPSVRASGTNEPRTHFKGKVMVLPHKPCPLPPIKQPVVPPQKDNNKPDHSNPPEEKDPAPYRFDESEQAQSQTRSRSEPHLQPRQTEGQ